MPIPKPTEFLLNVPLYAKVLYDGEELWEVIDILYYGGTYDCFCTKCGREATFRVESHDRPSKFVRNLAVEAMQRKAGVTPEIPSLSLGMRILEAFCTRTRSHTQMYVVLVEQEPISPTNLKAGFQNSIQKIGQFPSYADLHIAQTKKYAPVLSPEQRGELNRAIGLASHNIGVGSFVYLRRIFQTLVEEAHQASTGDEGWDEEQYQRLRMGEQVKLLKDRLPSFLVENAAIYSLLSKGIHELSETECLKHFDTLRIGIEIILDEHLQIRERDRKIADAKAAIQKAVGGAGEGKTA